MAMQPWGRWVFVSKLPDKTKVLGTCLYRTKLLLLNSIDDPLFIAQVPAVGMAHLPVF